MLINWNRQFFFFFFFVVMVTGFLKMCRPSWCGGCGFTASNFEPDLSPGLEDFTILWLAANY